MPVWIIAGLSFFGGVVLGVTITVCVCMDNVRRSQSRKRWWEDEQRETG